VPTSFLPDEDQGYAYVVVQLPNAASLERTNAVVSDVEKVILNTPGVQFLGHGVGRHHCGCLGLDYSAEYQEESETCAIDASHDGNCYSRVAPGSLVVTHRAIHHPRLKGVTAIA
jgi:multidrug efflux pump subunit AcrB